jgi:hypothetical protein
MDRLLVDEGSGVVEDEKELRQREFDKRAIQDTVQ